MDNPFDQSDPFEDVPQGWDLTPDLVAQLNVRANMISGVLRSNEIPFDAVTVLSLGLMFATLTNANTSLSSEAIGLMAMTFAEAGKVGAEMPEDLRKAMC